jgi:hypothetical protein
MDLLLEADKNNNEYLFSPVYAENPPLDNIQNYIDCKDFYETINDGLFKE